ncbi:DEAD/DEAH box helicase [Corynebacterium uterequi]|nr:DEAD/DEAH box helicase [Corynebacterium uterequi]
MASHLLHGLWLADLGLCLWVEQVDGHRIVLPSAVPDGTFPPAVEGLLRDSMFRHRTSVKLQTPKGRDVELALPVAAIAPERAIEWLGLLAYLDGEHPAATREQRNSLAPDLRWLIRMYVGMKIFAQAGRVTIRLHYADRAWYPQWQLATGMGERGWVAEMINAAPGILTANNHSLAEDLTTDLVHWVTNSLLTDLHSAPRPYPWHDFAEALMTSSALRRGGPGLLRAINDWRASVAAVDVQLLFVVEQPPADNEEMTDPADATWPVRALVRSGTGSPQPIHLSELDAASKDTLRRKYMTATAVTSLVDYLSHPMDESSYERRGHQFEGDWDTYLSTDDVVTFISKDAEKLRELGFIVMLPKAWSVADTKASLSTRRAVDDAAGPSLLGFDQLMDYNWRMSVGDVELTDAEMAELVASKSGLIRLRGQWVLADAAAIRRVSSYMSELETRSTKRITEEITNLRMNAELLKSLGSDEWEERLAEAERLEAELAEKNSALGTLPLSELRRLAVESTADDPIEFTGTSWHNALLGGPTTPAPERIAIPDTVHAELREYQRRGVDWLYWMARNKLGAVLADDMGLGKTLQLLALVAVEKDRGELTGPTLVVAPTSVVGNWAKEASRFVPSLRVHVHHGPHRLHGVSLARAMAEADVVIVSYGVVTRDHRELGATLFHRVVLDEAQAIKNSGTKSSRAVRSLPSGHRVALTGTPVENRLSEMRSILDFVNPGVLGSASFFRNHFAKAIEREEDGEMADRLRQLIAPFILRRLKTDTTIIDDLPEKNETILRVEMTPEQAALYQALTDNVAQEIEEREGMQRRGLVLATITRIKQICNHPAHFLGDGSPVTIRGRHRSGKVRALMTLLDKAVRTDQRMLIFTQYRVFGEILQPFLTERLGHPVPFLHGGTTKTARDAMVDEFQRPGGPRAMILSLKAGGTGLNLTAASMVVHMDRWWNPAVENQATDRAFRIGQGKDVEVYKMITVGTMEESIQDILDGKTKLAGAVITEGEGWITELDPDQLAQLISYRGREE